MKKYSELAKTVSEEIRTSLSQVDDQQIEKLVQEIVQAKKIFVAGAGRSGLMIKAFAMRLMHMGLDVYVVSEIVTPSFQENDLLIIASGSGETGSLVSMANKIEKLKGRLALLTIHEESSIGKLADCIVKIPGATPKSALEDTIVSIQPMGSLFEQSLLLVMDIVIVMIMEKLDINAEEMFKKHANLE